MRKSLPSNTKSRRSTRRDLAVEDMRTRTPSRELINSDINGLVDQDQPSTANTLTVKSLPYNQSSPALLNGINGNSDR